MKPKSLCCIFILVTEHNERLLISVKPKFLSDFLLNLNGNSFEFDFKLDTEMNKHTNVTYV